MSNKEIHRCLKRYIVRELYPLFLTDLADSTPVSLHRSVNAPAERLWGSLKVARLHGRHFATRRAAMDEIVDWLGFYNSRRLHSTLDYASPMTFEQNWRAAQQGEAA